MLARSGRASCTDGTDNGTDGTRRTGIIRRPVPRTVPRESQPSCGCGGDRRGLARSNYLYSVVRVALPGMRGRGPGGDFLGQRSDASWRDSPQAPDAKLADQPAPSLRSGPSESGAARRNRGYPGRICSPGGTLPTHVSTMGTYRPSAATTTSLSASGKPASRALRSRPAGSVVPPAPENGRSQGFVEERHRSRSARSCLKTGRQQARPRSR